MKNLHAVEYTPLYWRFQLMPEINANEALTLARQRLEYRHPDMVFWPLLSPDLHMETGQEGHVAAGLRNREIVLVLNIFR